MTSPRFHFISGLPRSGSTLLAALLRQNPAFSARMSSPLFNLFDHALLALGGEGARFVTEAQRRAILGGLFANYYADHADKHIVFDTNRGWCGRLPALHALLPESRIVCMVRNVAWIMDSIERLIRRNALLPSRLFSDGERANVYSRCEAIGARNRLVGSAWSSLKEAFYGDLADNLLVIDYDYLAASPQETLGLIYRFLGEPIFQHDFERVVYDESEFDWELNTPGLHTVAPKIELRDRRTVLPPDLFEQYAKLSFWSDPAPSLANLVAPQRAEPDPAP